MSTRSKRDADRSLNAKHTQILRECLRQPENRYCADCRKKDPRWASWNLGIFICIRCSGTHRSMGTHISRVKSVDLDTWTPEQVENMVRWGNAKANAYWEANLNSTPPESNIDQWIRSKYEMKRWAMKGPIPDPSSLSEGYSIQSDNNPSKKEKSNAKNKIDILVSSDDPNPKSSITNADDNSISQLKGAELFSLGKPSSAPSSPTQEKASLPLPRSTTPNPVPSPAPSHDMIKSSILSLYNNPTPRPVANNNNNTIFGHHSFNSSSPTLSYSPARSNNYNTSNSETMPQGGQFFEETQVLMLQKLAINQLRYLFQFDEKSYFGGVVLLFITKE
ncbi:8612_t:CDS:2 [Ambispora leptoticha]|uniref:8612_t:CDS:1 n=1 Tax=Ambispora leptoticha TaxID=144679 RepID=A0A9N8ZK21_9GLOM|nr:8612_t:CDS:2 [Ambispora leptoticha]